MGEAEARTRSGTSARPDRAIVVALFAAAALIRLVHLSTIRSSPFFMHLSLDPLAYDEWGMRIAAGSWLGDRIFYQDPLYPYFLGVLYSVFGHSYAKVVVVQALLGSLVPPLVFAAARRWIERGPALVAGILAVLYAPAIYYEGLILKSWMEAFFLAVALWTLSSAIRTGRALWWSLAGLTVGLGCLVRANFLLFLPLLAVWCWLDRSAHPRSDSTAAMRLRTAGALLAGAACILVPCAIRNRVVGGEWVLTTSQGGQNFYLGNNAENTSGEYEALPFVGANPKHEERGFATEAERRAGRALTPTEVSRFWFRAGLTWLREHPGDWLWLLGKKARVFTSSYEVPDNLDYYLYQAHAPVLRLPLPGFGFLAPLGIVGAFLWIRRSGWPRAVLWIAVVYSSSVVLFYVFARYRLGLTPALFPLAGFTLWELGRSVLDARERGRRALVLAAGTVASFAFVNLPVRAPEDYWSYRLASSIGLPVQRATTAMAHFNLGVTLAREAKEAPQPGELLDRAETELREAVRQEPGRVQFRVELGKVLARESRQADAIEQYEAALRIEPRDWRTWHALGILYRRNRDDGNAERCFRRASELAPAQADSLVALGQLLRDQHRDAEATEMFRSALRIAPANEPARRGLQELQP